ncbi:MAG: hypothetical protein NT169_21120 [Chloroflexi bacterium]|nr:hypothetical protein [Chloroflexota bacterium]
MDASEERAHPKSMMAELTTAWAAADDAGLTDPRAIGRQIRYALIACSTDVKPGCIPTELLAALVREKVIGWPPQAALRYVSQIPSERDRAYAVTQLAPLLPTELLPVALTTVASLTDPQARGRAIGDLATRLPSERVPELPLLAAAIQEPFDRAAALNALLPHLPPSLATQAALDAWSAVKLTGNPFTIALYCGHVQPYLPPDTRAGALAEALAALEAASEQDVRARGIDMLAPHLTGSLLVQALRLASALSDAGWRASALLALLPHLPAETRDAVVQQALAAVRAIQPPFELNRAVLLLDLLAYLPPNDHQTLFDEALEHALRGLGLVLMGRVSSYDLANLVERLPEPQLYVLMDKILAMYRKWPDADFRGRSARQLLPRLVERMPVALIPEVLQLARTLTYDERDQCDVLVALASRLNPDLQAEALTCVAEMQHPCWRGDVLAALAPHLAAQHLATALRMASALPLLYEDFSPYIEATAALVPRLAPEQRDGLLSTLLAAARKLPVAGEWRCPRVEAFRLLAPLVSEEARQELLLEACRVLREAPRAPQRVRLFTDLAAELPPPHRQAVLLDALAAARRHDDDYAVSEFLAGLAPHLPVDLRRSALRQAASSALARPRLWDGYDRWAAIPRGLAADMPLDVMAEALAAILTYPEAPRERPRQADEFARLAPHLPAELMPQALAVVRALPDAHWSGSPRGEALAALAPYQPAPLIAEAYAIACALPEENEKHRGPFGNAPRLQAIMALFPYLPWPLQAAVLDDLGGNPESAGRSYVLSKLAPHLPADRRGAVAAEALPGLWQAEDLWLLLDGLLRLLPCLPPELGQQALADAWALAQQQPATLRHMFPLQSGLLRLAHHLPIPQRDELLHDQFSSICALEERGGGGYTLSELGEQLPPDLPATLLSDVLAAAHRLEDAAYRVRGVSGLVVRLAPPDRVEPLAAAVSVARQTASPNLRALFFAHLLPAFSPQDQPPVLAEALQAVQAGSIETSKRDSDTEVQTSRKEALRALASAWGRWADTDRQAAYALWPDTLHAVAGQRRDQFLVDLRALIPVALSLGAAETASQIAEAVVEAAAQP